MQVTPASLVSRLKAGLDALETKLITFQGEVTDNVDMIAWSERRQYIELICRLQGAVGPQAIKMEHSGPDGGPIPIQAVLATMSTEEVRLMRDVLKRARQSAVEPGRVGSGT